MMISSSHGGILNKELKLKRLFPSGPSGARFTVFLVVVMSQFSRNSVVDRRTLVRHWIRRNYDTNPQICTGSFKNKDPLLKKIELAQVICQFYNNKCSQKKWNFLVLFFYFWRSTVSRDLFSQPAGFKSDNHCQRIL